MSHHGRHEQPHKVLRLGLAVHDVHHAVIVIDAVARRDVSIRPTVVLDELAAQPLEGGQVGVGRAVDERRLLALPALRQKPAN